MFPSLWQPLPRNILSQCVSAKSLSYLLSPLVEFLSLSLDWNNKYKSIWILCFYFRVKSRNLYFTFKVCIIVAKYIKTINSMFNINYISKIRLTYTMVLNGFCFFKWNKLTKDLRICVPLRNFLSEIIFHYTPLINPKSTWNKYALLKYFD